jgi:hypothetical protein
MPLGSTGISVANRAVLVVMHVAVAAVLIPVLYRTAGRRLAQHRGRPQTTVVTGHREAA